MKAILAVLLVVSVCALVPAISVAAAAEVTIEDGVVGDLGGTTAINITLDTAPTGLSGYNLTLLLATANMAEIQAVEFPAWATIYANGSLPADTVWMKAVDMMGQVDPGATNIHLGTIIVSGDIQGECAINAAVTQMDPDGAGDPITPSIDSGVLTIAPVTLSFYPPTLTVYNESTDITIILDRAPSGLSGYNLTVSSVNAGIAEIISLEYPTWATFTGGSSLPADSLWLHATDGSYQIESGETNVTLATLTLRGDTMGQGTITVTVNLLNNDEGYSMPFQTAPAQLAVVPLVPFPGQTNPPTDPDGDGLYEDINGNGVLDFDDVNAYFNNMEWIEENAPISLFDYNGNGRIDFNDLELLFEEV
ncbi:MAG: hypothetical protein ACP5E9_10000 [Candidatus Methanospirareceae archaeon]